MDEMTRQCKMAWERGFVCGFFTGYIITVLIVIVSFITN